jgi:hypothetical protein
MSRLIDGPLDEREAAFRDERGVGPRSVPSLRAPRPLGTTAICAERSFWAAGSEFRRSEPKPSREDARTPRVLASLRGKDQASPAKSDSASTISGIAGVGEKPPSAGARTERASAGRFKDR